MDFDYSKLPFDFVLCPDTTCPRAGQCLRQVLFNDVPASVRHIHILSPAAARQAAGAACPYFRMAEKVRFAQGIEGVLKQLKRLPYTEAVSARNAVYGYFKKSAFYRIRHGQRFVSPEEQEQVRAIFRRFGLKEEPAFDEYIYLYNLSY